MMNRRLGRGAFFGLWLPLVAAQAAVLTNVMAETPSLDPRLGAALVGLLQLLKLPITAFRLNDIGRPASDALFFVVIPVANIVGLLRFMPEATPSPAAWDRRRKGWASQIGPIEAAIQALPLAARTAPVALPVAVLYGAVMAVGGWWVLEQLQAAATTDAATRASLAQAFTAITAFLALYTGVQFVKRGRATRISWFPSLFLLPAALTAGAFAFFDAGVQNNLQFMLVMLAYSAWQMAWMSVGGATLMVAATLSAEQVRNGGSLDAGQVFGQLPSRTLDVAGPHGARVQAVTIGMQIVIPGIFYLLQLAFADAIAVLDPEASSLKRSGELTWGMRSRLFKLFLASTLVTMLVHFAVVAAIGSVEQAMAYYFNPSDMSFAAFTAGEIVWGISAWLLQLALLLMYHDRVRYLEERRAERKLHAGQPAPADGAPAHDAPVPSPA
jgi:hypothetical protein